MEIMTMLHTALAIGIIVNLIFMIMLHRENQKILEACYADNDSLRKTVDTNNRAICTVVNHIYKEHNQDLNDIYEFIEDLDDSVEFAYKDEEHDLLSMAPEKTESAE